MPANLSIKNVPDDVVARIRARAVRNHRSLQGELMSIITEEARRSRLDAYIEEANRAGFSTPATSAAIIREDRDRADGCR